MTINYNTIDHPKRHFSLIRSKHSSRIVGLFSPGYNAEKVSYGLPVKHFSFKKLFRIPVHKFEKKGSFLKNTPLPIDNSVGLLHTFNEIPITTRPFVISFENELPRYLNNPPKYQKDLGYKLLSSDRCKYLLALSNNCAKISRDYFNSIGLKIISDKIIMFRGGLQKSVRHIEKAIPKSDQPIKALFVGGEAFRKGLIPTIEAIKLCRNQGINVELTVISKMTDQKRSYVFKEFTPDTNEWRNKLADYSFVRFLDGLPNHLVRKEMSEHEIFLFPSLEESLGWVIIEAGLEALPALATNIYAIPELIEDEADGFLTKIDLGKENRWIGIWKDGSALKASIDRANHQIKTKIIEIMERISQDRSLTIKLGRLAQKKFLELYGIENAAKTIENIYQSCLD